MVLSNLDNLPEDLQKAIYYVFNNVSVRDKIIFLSKLQYGNDLTYREIADSMGITFQRTQQLYDGMIQDISNIVNCSGFILSGVVI